MAHDRVSVLQALQTQGVCPVFYHPDAEVSLNVIRACARGGAPVIEFTNRGDFAADLFGEIARELGRTDPDIVLGIGSVISNLRPLDTGARAEGEVVRLVGSKTASPRVRFVDDTGRAVEFTSSAGRSPPAYSVGERVEVVYPAGEPDRAVIRGGFSMWGFVAIGGGLGLLCTLIGIGAFYN